MTPRPRRILVLLDNHHAPDRRTAWLSSVTRAAGIDVRIVAWDRRADGVEAPPRAEPGEQVVELRVPAPPGGGVRTLAAVARFGARVLRRRAALLDGVDAVIACDVYLLPLGAALAHVAQLPLVYDAREEHAALEAGRYPAWLLAAVERVETLLARRARLVIVPGEARVPRWERAGVEPVVLRNVGTTLALAGQPARWDVAMAGLLTQQRRPDLVVALARRRPDLRFVLTGRGRLEPELRQAAANLPNLDYLAWVEDVDATLAASAVVLYGQDPDMPYSELACPNTLYQAIRLRRPLVFYCAGEPATVAARFRIGARCAPTVEALEGAIEEARARRDWQFDDAWKAIASDAPAAYVGRLREVLARRSRGHDLKIET